MNLNQSSTDYSLSDPQDMTAGRKAQDFLRERLAKRDSAKGETPVSNPTHTYKPPTGSSTPYKEQTSQIESKNWDNALNYSARNEAKHNFSMNNFNATDRANAAGQQAENITHSRDMFKGLRQSTLDMSDYYQQRSRERTINIFGDIWNQDGPPEWVAPEDPEKIEADLDKYEVDFD